MAKPPISLLEANLAVISVSRFPPFSVVSSATWAPASSFLPFSFPGFPWFLANHSSISSVAFLANLKTKSKLPIPNQPRKMVPTLLTFPNQNWRLLSNKLFPSNTATTPFPPTKKLASSPPFSIQSWTQNGKCLPSPF